MSFRAVENNRLEINGFMTPDQLSFNDSNSVTFSNEL
jgi:hypothetical protein